MQPSAAAPPPHYHRDFPHGRDPPPYPGASAGQQHTPIYQPGYRQSYSGSEASTDLSLSSSENLSCLVRQDPQGEETGDYTHDPAYSILARLTNNMTSGPLEVKAANNSTFYVTGPSTQPGYGQPPQSEVNLNNNCYSVAVTTMGNYPQHQIHNIQGMQYSNRPQSALGLYQPHTAATSTPMAGSKLTNRNSLPNPSLYYQQHNQNIVNQLQHQNLALNSQLVAPQQDEAVNYGQGVQSYQRQSPNFHQPKPGPSPGQSPQTKPVFHGHPLRHDYVNVPGSGASMSDTGTGSSVQRPGLVGAVAAAQQNTSLQQYKNQLAQQSQQNQQKQNLIENKQRELFLHLQQQQQKQQQQQGQQQQYAAPTSSSSSKIRGDVTNVRAREVVRSMTPNSLPSKPLAVSLPARPSSANSRSKDRKLSLFNPNADWPSSPTSGVGTSISSNSSANTSSSKSPKSSQSSATSLSSMSSPPPLPLPPTSGSTPLKSPPAYSSTPTTPTTAPVLKKTMPPRPKTAPMEREQQPPPPLPGYLAAPVGSVASHAAGGASSAAPAPASASEEEKKELRRSYEMLDRLQLTRSQPDLTRIQQHLSLQQQQQARVATIQQQQQQIQQLEQQHQQQLQQLQKQQQLIQQQQQQPEQQQQQLIDQVDANHNTKPSAELDHAAIATRATQMVERLSEENRSLRTQLEGYYNKVCKLQKFEAEIQKVTEAYESLNKNTQRREQLEKVMRYKLDAEVKKIRETNKDLKEQLDSTLMELQKKAGPYKSGETDLANELLKKDAMISKLIAQNRDLTSARERLESEAEVSSNKMEEQKAHIEILDQALATAQTNALKLDDETSRRRFVEERVEELQKALSQLQLATERRHDVEQQLRAGLEEEVRTLKAHKGGVGKASDTDEGIASDSESPTSVQSLVRQMHERDQQILQLKADIAKWEHKYIEESALRQLAVEAASMPKISVSCKGPNDHTRHASLDINTPKQTDMRIAALEQNSADTEKLIAESRTDKLRHLEEVYRANRKTAAFEAKVKMLTAQVAEKEAMIKVLQRHTSLSRTSSVSSLFTSPMHSPHPSITASTPSHTPPSSLVSMSTPASGSSSRQNSQLDPPTTASNPASAAKPPIHTRSNSTGSAPTSSSSSNVTSTSTLKDLQTKLAAQQASLVDSLESSDSTVQKSFWQV